MGVIWGSLTGGKGNIVGAIGEIVAHAHIGGQRVSEVSRHYDIVSPEGVRVDVKTAQGRAVPLPRYVARVYGHEDEWTRLAYNCDVYYFLRSDHAMTRAFILGWLPAVEFFRLAEFTPKGETCITDGRIAYADEFSVPISSLNTPDVPLSSFQQDMQIHP